MKTLKDHVIVYDDECPLCQVYTKAFVTSGMLDKEGRTPYCNIDKLSAAVDKERAANEIALIDKTTGEVTYGVRSLTKVIGHNMPWLNGLMHAPIFQTMMRPLYAFISYNRKVIVPGSGHVEGACVPHFNVRYRVAYIVVAWLAISFLLNALPPQVRPLIPAEGMFTELMICGGQIFFQGLIISLYYRDTKTTLSYLGNMMTVSFIGALLLLPAWVAVGAGIALPWLYNVWFIAVVAVMFLEHARRVKLHGWHGSLSLTWIAYRFLVLGLNIKFLITAIQQ